MNDPNGLIRHGGVHHLFFQHNPHDTAFGRMYWGHATSTDLVHWTEHPIALSPGDSGNYDADGCWSGCAVVLDDGSVHLVYTGNRDGRTLPCLATAVDVHLREWAKSPQNPVIDHWPTQLNGLTDLRDHAVVPAGGGFRQLVATGGSERGAIIAYRSAGQDLTEWSYDGVLLSAAGASLPGDVWECPDLFTIDGQDVLLLSYYDAGHTGNDVIWVTGSHVDGGFEPLRYGRLDFGDRLYAPQSYAPGDGRRLLFGWLRTHLDPASADQPFTGAMSLPRELILHKGRLGHVPAAETLRPPRVARAEFKGTAGCTIDPVAAAEIVLTVSTPQDLTGLRLQLGGSDSELELDFAVFAAPAAYLWADGQWQPEAGSATSARVVFDGGLVEVFLDDGRSASYSDLCLAHLQRVNLLPGGAETAEAHVTVAEVLT
jgi:beta-fructofuranosidase